MVDGQTYLYRKVRYLPAAFFLAYLCLTCMLRYSAVSIYIVTTPGWQGQDTAATAELLHHALQFND
jgi:hypothetical protein